MEDNSHAGQGSVLLDIGGDVGALVVTMPAAMEGREVEIRPVAAGGSSISDDHDPDEHESYVHAHSHGGHAPGAHAHSHGFTHEHGEPHNPPAHLPHVAVVGRPLRDGVSYTLVFPELIEGRYELYERPAGPVRLTVSISGAEVRYASWPGE